MKLRLAKIFSFPSKAATNERAVDRRRPLAASQRHERTALRVREIKVSVLRNAFQQFAGARASQLVPSHVRQAIDGRQRGNFLREQSEARVSRCLVARGKHSLQAEANSE